VVSGWHYTRWIAAAAAALVLPASLLHAALPSHTDIPASPTSLTGQLLIASPQMHDPPFARTVILMAQHNRGGALGVVINRPLEQPRAIAGLLTAFGADASGVTESVRVFVGGPVNPEVGFVLHSAEYRVAGTLDIDGRLALTAAVDILRDIGLHKGPSKSLVAFGYAGWAPAQLESEMAHGAWVTVPEDPALVFDEDRAQVWADALARYKH